MLTVGLALSLASGIAQAAETGFSIAEAAYVRTEHHGNGYLLRGSGTVGSRLFVEGNYEQTPFSNKDLYQASLGIGVRWPLTDSVQWFVAASGEAIYAPTGGELYEDEFTFTGFGIRAGLRGQVGERLELAGSLKYDNINDKLMPSVGARYFLSRHLAAGIDFSDEFYGTRVMAVLRFDFTGMR